MLIDFLKISSSAGIPLESYTYIGMGGIRFFDFVLVHRFLGISRMISLEQDGNTFRRSQFNSPYTFIRVVPGNFSDFIVTHGSSGEEVFWLDYDWGLSQEVVSDIADVGARVQPGTFLFITVSGELPARWRRLGLSERLGSLSEDFGYLVSGFTEKDVAEESYPSTAFTVLMRSLTSSFLARAEGKFFPFFRVAYRDTTRMITVGGIFASAPVGGEIGRLAARALPFLKVHGSQPYQIRNYNLTERERRLFDRATTGQRRNSRDANTLRSLGFKSADFREYGNLLRFIPRYFESIV